MSGYVFHCTPCGLAHAGECPPKAKSEVKKDDWRVTIHIGSRWKCERIYPHPLYVIWTHIGPTAGFEVMSIITNGLKDSSAVQIREWGDPGSPVATVPLKLWEPDGFDDGCGFIKRMVAWT